MYGANEVKVQLKNGMSFTMIQETNYPWDGLIRFRFRDIRRDQSFTLMIRVPGWVESGIIQYAGQTRVITENDGNTYIPLEVKRLEDSRIEVRFDMPARYTIAHPFVEENGNQVAVERGPIIYCMENPDADVETLDDILLLSDAEFYATDYEILGKKLVALETKAAYLRKKQDRRALYQPLKIEGIDIIPVRMIPYFAWDNRGYGEMRIWMPIMYQLT
jgi:hypothetical protein